MRRFFAHKINVIIKVPSGVKSLPSEVKSPNKKYSLLVSSGLLFISEIMPFLSNDGNGIVHTIKKSMEI